MHEKDIELTRLLLTEHKERLGKAASLLEELSTARQELDSVLDVRKERENIHDVLSRAAALLEREDLGVDLPESGNLEKRVIEMENNLSGIQADVAKYEGLLDELKEKAPELLKAAQADSAGADSTEAAGPAGEAKPNPKQAPSAEDQDGGGPEHELAELELDEAREPAHAILSKMGKRERKKLLSVFKLKSLIEKEAYAHGRGAVYLVDTRSIFGQVKSYGYNSPKANHGELNSKLAFQFYGLSLELSGSFHLVFNAAFPDHNSFGDLVSIEAVSGDAADYSRKVLELTGSYSGKLRTVCLVTDDPGLAEALDGQGVHLIPLSEFFN